jgi:hypothetical protein
VPLTAVDCAKLDDATARVRMNAESIRSMGRQTLQWDRAVEQSLSI